MRFGRFLKNLAVDSQACKKEWRCRRKRVCPQGAVQLHCRPMQKGLLAGTDLNLRYHQECVEDLESSMVWHEEPLANSFLSVMNCRLWKGLRPREK